MYIPVRKLKVDVVCRNLSVTILVTECTSDTASLITKYTNSIS
jgi:hypothetical protein